MKSHEITNEMTWRGPDYEVISQKFAEKNRENWLSGKYIADIEQYRVLVTGNFYSLWDDEDVLAAYSSLIDNIVDDIWVNPNYRRQHLFSKMLWFFKSRLNKNPLVIGKIHSPAMQEVIKGLSKFNKSWLNVNTNEVKPFDATTVDEYYSNSGITDWRLIIESMGDFSDFPMFRTGSSYIKEDYTEIIK